MQRARRNQRTPRRLYVGIVGSSACLRESLLQSLGAFTGFRTVDCGTGNAESVSRACDLGVRIVLASLDPGPAASFAGALRDTNAGIRVVLLLRAESDGVVARLAHAGVTAFIPPRESLHACARTVRAVGSQGFASPYSVISIVANDPAKQAEASTGLAKDSSLPLHGRRLEVAECLAAGLSNKEIADLLHIREPTVKNHVHAVLRTLGVGHRWQVAGKLPPSLPTRRALFTDGPTPHTHPLGPPHHDHE